MPISNLFQYPSKWIFPPQKNESKLRRGVRYTANALAWGSTTLLLIRFALRYFGRDHILSPTPLCNIRYRGINLTITRDHLLITSLSIGGIVIPYALNAKPKPQKQDIKDIVFKGKPKTCSIGSVDVVQNGKPYKKDGVSWLPVKICTKEVVHAALPLGKISEKNGEIISKYKGNTYIIQLLNLEPTEENIDRFIGDIIERRRENQRKNTRCSLSFLRDNDVKKVEQKPMTGDVETIFQLPEGVSFGKRLKITYPSQPEQNVSMTFYLGEGGMYFVYRKGKSTLDQAFLKTFSIKKSTRFLGLF